MKHIFGLLFMVVIFIGLNGCKPAKDESCVGMLCQNGGSCQSGDCICINGYTGNLCETPLDSCTLINCGPHGTCASGQCDCDPNWTGEHCDQQIVPIDSFPGTYILSGYKQEADTAGNAPQIPFSATAQITQYNSVTLMYNGAFLFNYQALVGSPDNYNYVWLSQNSGNRATLGFSKSMNDSVFYDAWNFNEHIVLSGKKQ